MSAETFTPALRGSLALASAFALAIGLAGCDWGKSQAAEKPPAAQTPKEDDHDHTEQAIRLSETEIKDAGISTEAMEARKMSDELALTANITANQNSIAHVAPRVEGLLIKVNANLGDQVTQGQVLATIDSIPMGEAQAEYRRCQSELTLSQTNYDRADGLFKQSVVPQRLWQEARSTLERAQANFRAATERLQMLGGLPDTGKPHFVVTAPFSGTVIEKEAVLGELAKPDKHMYIIADLSTVWIEADVLEKDVGKLAVGANSTIMLPAYPGETFTGKVTYVSNTLDRQTRTVKARIEAPNPEGKLRIDMYATVVVETKSPRDKMLSLPQSAVLLVQGQPTAYVLTDHGFEARQVETGEMMKGRVVIASGLAEGDKVVTAGAFALKARQLKSTLGDGQ
jgi:membrane fusion protein, heavy metal efflux system